MKLKEYTDKETMLAALREEAINTISCIINDWDGYPAEKKVSAIDGVLNFMAGIEESMVEDPREHT